MSKYNIEDNIDFYAELYNSLDDEKDELNDNNICLITYQPLIDKYVTLDCKHTFNYTPLYYYLVNQKKTFNHMEKMDSRLKLNEIRCPYCRSKQPGTLIYHEDLGLKKVNGVNYYDPYSKENNIGTHYTHKCQYVYINPNYNPNEEENIINSKYLINQQCLLPGSQIEIYNPLDENNPINYGDTNYYCYYHKKQMIKHYKLEKKQKDMMLIKEAKQIKKQEKLAMKAKEKEEKLKAKQMKQLLKSKPIHENVVLGPSVIENQVGCIQVLKSGPNKGKSCGCTIKSDNLCFRHYKSLKI